MTAVAPLALRTRPARAFRALDGASVVGFIGPNWFAAVMGTGIVPIALVGLPVDVPGARLTALVLWLVAVGLFLVVGAATIGHHLRHPEVARGHRSHQVLAHFYGAPAMALMTVGAGTLLVGRDLIGLPAAIAVDAVLWTLGTALGLVTTFVVPLRAHRAGHLRAADAFGGWLMPVVPPMVTAATGALLVPHLPGGLAAQALLVFCYVCFALTLVASVPPILLLVRRLLVADAGPAAMVPTLWIVLGPLGQSITAAHHLGASAVGVVSASLADTLASFALDYGRIVWILALLWGVVAASVTVRTARSGRAGLPFSLTWWSFTFPVGTVVTGTSALAASTGLVLFQVAAVALFASLVVAVAVVLTRTLHGAYVGHLLRAPA